jgi:hypothetical protein
LTFAVILAAAAVVGRADAACQPLTPAPGVEGYQGRSNSPRCEGMYAANVAGPSFELVSLTKGRLEYDLDHPPVLRVRPLVASATSLSVQAVGVVPGLYYRMDAELEPDRTLDWPVKEVLALRDIHAEAIGILGIRYLPGRQPTFIPLQVATQVGQMDPATPLIAVLKAPLDPPEAILWRFTAAGQTTPDAWQKLALQTYRAEIELTVTGKPLSGKLQVSWRDPQLGAARSADFDIGS